MINCPYRNQAACDAYISASDRKHDNWLHCPDCLAILLKYAESRISELESQQRPNRIRITEHITQEVGKTLSETAIKIAEIKAGAK